jgi:hypothetical protein
MFLAEGIGQGGSLTKARCPRAWDRRQDSSRRFTSLSRCSLRDGSGRAHLTLARQADRHRDSLRARGRPLHAGLRRARGPGRVGGLGTIERTLGRRPSRYMYPVGRLAPDLDARSIEGWQPRVSKTQLCVCGKGRNPPSPRGRRRPRPSRRPWNGKQLDRQPS